MQAIIFPSSYLPEFDGKHWLHRGALSLCLPLPPSLPPSARLVLLYGGWVVVLLGDLPALEGFFLLLPRVVYALHPLRFAPCARSLRIFFPMTEDKQTNRSNVSRERGFT